MWSWIMENASGLSAVGTFLIPAVEVKPQAGDVLFYDLLCGHTGSTCLAREPRLAYNHKFGVEWSHERHSAAAWAEGFGSVPNLT